MTLADSVCVAYSSVDPGGPISGYHTRLWIRGLRVRSRPGSMDFSERKYPEYDFLRKGSKVMGPVWSIYGT